MEADGHIDGGTVLRANRLKAERDRFVALAFCWADLLFELDRERRIVFAGGATLPLLGERHDHLVGQAFQSLVAPGDRGRALELLGIAERQGRIDDESLCLSGRLGDTPPMALAGYRLDDLDAHFFLALHAGKDGGQLLGFRTSSRDVETGLLSAEAFAEAATESLSRLREAGEDARLSLITLPGFTDLRMRLDTGGDQALLAAVGAQFRAQAVDGETVARIDEDRFGFVHQGALDDDAFRRQLRDTAGDVDPSGGGMAAETVTFDMSDPGVSEADLANCLLFLINRFRDTKGAEFTIKSLSRNLPALVDETMQSVDVLRRVITQSAFELAFQPIVEVMTGKIHHYEALTRFHGGGENESPYRQIAFAEETGLIIDFDLAVARRVVEWLAQWPRNTTRCRVALNMSGVSIANDRYVESLHLLLQENQWVSDKLLFEITESSRMADLRSANRVIQGLRKRGHQVCLDDFGAGAASFQYLSALDVDVVKIDGGAIRNAQRSHRGRAFLTALTALCHSLAINTIAEMVDTEARLLFVQKCGVDFVQGWLFGKPSTKIGDFKPLPGFHLFGAAR